MIWHDGDEHSNIESQRQHLYDLVMLNGGNMLHPSVVQASQLLDVEIVSYTKNHPENHV